MTGRDFLRAVFVVLLLGFGVLSIVTAQSLLRPATNPIGGATREFQRTIWIATIAGAVSLGLAAALAVPSVRSRAIWKVAWTFVALLFIGPGVVILIQALGTLANDSGSPLLTSNVSFSVAFGASSVALGTASLLCGWWWRFHRPKDVDASARDETRRRSTEFGPH